MSTAVAEPLQVEVHSVPDVKNVRNTGRLLTLFVFIAISIVCSMDRFIFGALLTPIKSDLGLTDEQAGRGYSVFALAYVIGIPLFGYLGNKLKRKGLILAGLVLWSLASAGSGLAASLAAFLTWRALVGFGEGSFQTLAPSWLADLFEPRWRNLVFGFYNSMAYVGCSVGYIAGGILSAHYGWHVAFYVAGVPGLILAVALLFLKEPRRGQAENQAGEITRPTFRESLGIFKIPNYLIFLVGYVFYYFGMGGLLWGPAFLHRTFGLSNQEGAAFFGLGFLFAAPAGAWLGGVIGSFILSRFRAGYGFWLSGSAFLAGIAFYNAFQATDLLIAKIGILSGQFLVGLSVGTATTVLLESVPLRHRVTAIATALALAGALGSILSSEIIGTLSDHFGLSHALLVEPLVFSIAALAWGILAIRHLRQTPKNERVIAQLS